MGFRRIARDLRCTPGWDRDIARRVGFIEPSLLLENRFVRATTYQLRLKLTANSRQSND